jgi:hypothetical protein
MALSNSNQHPSSPTIPDPFGCEELVSVISCSVLHLILSIDVNHQGFPFWNDHVILGRVFGRASRRCFQDNQSFAIASLVLTTHRVPPRNRIHVFAMIDTFINSRLARRISSQHYQAVVARTRPSIESPEYSDNNRHQRTVILSLVAFSWIAWRTLKPS